MTGCAHLRTQAGLVSAAALALDCAPAQLQVTEYLSYPYESSTVEGCRRIGTFAYREGRWRLESRCAFRTTPSIPSDHSPNRGGEVTCVKECLGAEQCADLGRRAR